MNTINIKELKAIVENWARSIEPGIRIYLFGSQSKGTATHKSDIDLAIEFLEKISKDEIDNIIVCDGLDLEEAIKKAMNRKVCLEDYQIKKVRDYVKDGHIVIYEHE